MQEKQKRVLFNMKLILMCLSLNFIHWEAAIPLHTGFQCLWMKATEEL